MKILKSLVNGMVTFFYNEEEKSKIRVIELMTSSFEIESSNILQTF